jgi:hypothetical protein
MAPSTNYGSTLTFNGATIGKCVVEGFPEISTGKIDTTNHAGGGKAESIPSGLVSLGDLTVTVLEEAGTLAAIKTYIDNKTVGTIAIANNSSTMSGQGYFLSVAPGEADAQDPDANKLEVALACTGAWTVT